MFLAREYVRLLRVELVPVARKDEIPAGECGGSIGDGGIVCYESEDEVMLATEK